jgi:hypothetical protein
MGEGRRYSFDDAMNRRARELEDALEQQRQVLRSEGQAQAAHILRAGAAQVATIESVGAGRASGVHWESAEEHEQRATNAREQTGPPERATTEQRPARDDVTKPRASERSNPRAAGSEAIEQVVAAARERIKQTAAAETRRIAERAAASHDEMHTAAVKEAEVFEETTRARLVEAEDALRAQATQTQDDMRRAADEEASAFDQVAGTRVVELQEAVSEHSELLDQLTRLHATTTEQIEEVRALVVELHEAQDRQPDPDPEPEQPVRMVVHGLAPGTDGASLGSTPDRRGLDHEGRVVGSEEMAEERLADLDGYVERSEAAQRALEERLADLEAEMAESVPARDGSGSGAPPRIEEFEAALAAAAGGFEERLRAVADEHTRRLEQAGAVTKNQLLESLAQAEQRLALSADGRATDLGQMIAAARTTIERAANSRVESLETTAVELRDGIEELQRDIAAALEETGEAQSAALDKAANDWLKRMENGGRKNGGMLRRRAAPGATAVVLAIAAALGGTMFLRGGGSDRPSIAAANPPAERAAPAKKAPTGDASQMGQVADALSKISWPSTTLAPLSWRAPGTGSAAAPNGTAAPGAGSSASAPAPTGGGSAPAAPAPTQPPPQTSPPPPPPSQSPPPTLLPPITLFGP